MGQIRTAEGSSLKAHQNLVPQREPQVGACALAVGKRQVKVAQTLCKCDEVETTSKATKVN